jgi:transcription termination factor NusB
MKSNLTVTQVDEPKVLSKGGKIYNFKAKDEANNELRYQTFSGEIGTILVEGMKFEAEVDTKERDYQGTTYIDRLVKQAWVDGKPVKSEEKKDYHKPDFQLEAIRTKSIQKQVALKAAVESIPNGSLTEQLERAERYFAYLNEGIIPYEAPQATPAVPQEATAPSVTKDVASIATPVDFEKSLAKEAKRLGWKVADVTKYLGENMIEYGGKTSWKALDTAEQAILLLALQKMK